MLRLDRVDPGEPLLDFPLPVVLDDQRAALDLLDAAASNIRFVDPGTGAVLPHEIEQVGQPGGPPLVAWVRVPQIIGLTTEIAVEIGDGLPAPSTTPVWSATYEAVYHLSDDAHDATPNHHDGTLWGGTAIPATAGMIGPARAFSGGPGAYIIPDAAGLDAPQLTVSGWVLASATSNAYQTIVGRSVTVSNYDDFWLGVHAGRQRVEVVVVPTTDVGFDAGAVTTGTWVHLAFTADGTRLTPYLDGVAGSTHPTGAAVQHDPQPVVIGADEEVASTPNANYLDTATDEIRIEHGVRTPGWLRYDDAAQRDLVIDYGAVAR